MTRPLLYSVEREFDCTVEVLWAAWTQADQLQAWYHPAQLSGIEGATESELEVGGLWSCGVSAPQYNVTAFFYGLYTQISPCEMIEHTMHYTESRDEFEAKDMTAPSHLVVVNFESRGARSWVKYSQFGEMPEGQEKQAQAGMESYLDSLELFLERH